MASPVIETNSSIAANSRLIGSDKPGQSATQPGFGKMLDQTVQYLNQADQSILEANTGGPADLHDVMIAMEKADISLRLMVQVRNKAVEAYQEIMRMQV